MKNRRISPLFWILVCTGFLVAMFVLGLQWGQHSQSASAQNTSKNKAQTASAKKQSVAAKLAAVEQQFQKDIKPFLKKYCIRCHNAEEMNSGIRVDHFTGKVPDNLLGLWKGIRKHVSREAMPPEDEIQPSKTERQKFLAWIDGALIAARMRPVPKNGTVRRLTVSQYRNSLRDLLGLEDKLTDVLPPDSVSKDGFLNNGQTMILSPLLIEAYFNIAEKALDRCIVDENAKPSIQNFRMDLGENVNKNPLKDKLILGANSHLLRNQDFQVTQLVAKKPFDFHPFMMRTKYRFIEGYRGNATVRGWREFDSIYHAVFACMRGTRGYPKGLAYEPVPEGLLLRPAIPSAEIFKQSSTYGPHANFKISLRELPDYGRFRVTVKAARYDDGLLLDRGAKPLASAHSTVADLTTANTTTVNIPQAGIYQIDVLLPAKGKPGNISLTLDKRRFSGQLYAVKAGKKHRVAPFLLVRLPQGPLKLSAKSGNRKIVFTKLNENGDLAKRFLTFEKRVPTLGVHVGFRRDCGSTFARVDDAKPVKSTSLQSYVFEGSIANYPSPDVEKDNVNYLAGVREIAVRSEYTDGRDMPRLMIRSVEFEGPLYETWPPKTHRNIFIESSKPKDSPEYAREIIRSFASRAFRRPITVGEENSLFNVWKDSFARTKDFRKSVKDALLVVLTSPQFLFIIENSSTPEPEPLDDYELASKLSYFLWNTAPDSRLLKLARENRLHQSLDAEVQRMIRDPRFKQFTREFTSQWLNLDKFEVVEFDRKRFPTLTRDTKAELRQEPIHFLEYLIKNNLPLKNLIDSDFIVANEVVAAYYGLADKSETGLRFQPLQHGNPHLGGILTQAGILAGLSDGRESNPIKRGAWFARKIIAEPPDDPPPNVPELPKENTKNLTLRERLEMHRNQKGCRNCHSGIDPWGIPFEQFNAGGLFKPNSEKEALSTLPDKTTVKSFRDLQNYLVNDRIDQVAFSVLYHLSTYAVGRRLNYTEIETLKEKGLELKADGYRMRDMIRFVVKSPIFLEK
ncbi:MAG: hypothetical protein Tsb009_31680 [Planctomycetaceae bacterium]